MKLALLCALSALGVLLLVIADAEAFEIQCVYPEIVLTTPRNRPLACNQAPCTFTGTHASWGTTIPVERPTSSPDVRGMFQFPTPDGVWHQVLWPYCTVDGSHQPVPAMFPEGNTTAGRLAGDGWHP